MIKVESLFYYPIKSCGAVEANQLVVDQFGVKFDRQFLIVDENAKFITQRTHPKMALIQPSVKDGNLTVGFGGSLFQAQFPGGNIQTLGPTDVAVTVWKSEVQAVKNQNQDLQAALSEFLGLKVQLVSFTDQSQRETTKSGVGVGAQVKFADSTSFMLTSLESLEDLNSHLDDEVPMSRFRPNIVLSGVPAWGEDQLRQIKVGEVDLEVIENCGRCGIVNVDQALGRATSKEVLQKLSGFRKHGNSIDFGVRAVHRGTGQIRQGDLVHVQD